MAGGGGGVSSRKVMMDPVQEQQEEVRGPSSDAGVPAVAGAVNANGDGAAQAGNPGASKT